MHRVDHRRRRGGLPHNVYTNVLAGWTCQRAGDVLDVLRSYDAGELTGRLDLLLEAEGDTTNR